LESLTLKRFVITDSIGLDKLTWLKLLHIVDSVTDSLVSTSLHCLSAWRSYILFCPYSVYCHLCKKCYEHKDAVNLHSISNLAMDEKLP